VASLAGVPVAGHPLVPEDGFAYRADELAERVRPGDLVVLCQPNNPTGRGWSEEETKRVLQACITRGARLLLDECFLHLAWPPLPTPAASRSGAWPEEVLLLRAFTKDFAVPGLRVGYLLGERRAIAAVRAFQQSWPVNVVGEAFALACMEEGDPWLTRTRRRIALERSFLSAELAKRGFSVFSGAANFLLVRLPRNDAGQTVLAGSEVQRRLLPFRILLRTCTSFPGLGDDYVRLAVRRREENQRLCAALDEVFAEECRRG
jgi:threonine-phosphate decarboxylase